MMDRYFPHAELESPMDERPYLYIAILINSALYLTGVFVAGLMLGNGWAWKLALLTAGLCYLSYMAQLIAMQAKAAVTFSLDPHPCHYRGRRRRRHHAGAAMRRVLFGTDIPDPRHDEWRSYHEAGYRHSDNASPDLPPIRTKRRGWWPLALSASSWCIIILFIVCGLIWMFR